MSVVHPCRPYAFLLTALVGIPFTPVCAAPVPPLVIPAHAALPIKNVP